MSGGFIARHGLWSSEQASCAALNMAGRGARMQGVFQLNVLDFVGQMTRRLFLNTRLFGETREDQYSLDVLLGYYFGAGNIVQLAFKKSERSELLGRVGGTSVTLKVSYLLRF